MVSLPVRMRKRFVCFSAEFEQKLGDRREHIILKRDHSLRVYAQAGKIVVGEGIDRPKMHLAAALWHDIGRFPQFERFGTYRDDQSVDHGDLGAEILARGTYLEDFTPDARRCIIETVRLHNKRDLPPQLDPQVLSLCRVVRDADKLDIVRVVLSKMQPDAALDPVVSLGLADRPEAWCDSLFAVVAEGRSPSYTALRYTNDFKLLLASWGPALEFATSRRIFIARGYLDRIFALLPENARFAELKATLWTRLQASS